jgi:hypothetical protein
LLHRWGILVIILCTLSDASYATSPEIFLSLKDDNDDYLHKAIEPVFSVAYGELLFYKSQGDYKKNSYLEWEAKPVWYGGGKLAATFKSLLLSKVAFQLPGKCNLSRNLFDIPVI